MTLEVKNPFSKRITVNQFTACRLCKFLRTFGEVTVRNYHCAIAAVMLFPRNSVTYCSPGNAFAMPFYLNGVFLEISLRNNVNPQIAGASCHIGCESAIY